jgi:NAD(P)-dependent dehydrogenase (short-subunit alcohol dehydrogenase family)
LADGLAGSPGKLHPIRCDISKEGDILHAFSEVKEKLGGVDILVNNAGVLHETLLSGISPHSRFGSFKMTCDI